MNGASRLELGSRASAPPLVVVVDPGELMLCRDCLEVLERLVVVVVDGGRLVCPVCRRWRAGSLARPPR